MATTQPQRIQKAFAAWLDIDTFTGESLSIGHHTMEPKKKRSLKLSKLYSFACGISHSDVRDDGNAWHEGFSRVVHCNHPELSPEYGSNYVATTKYNMFTFVPKSLFEQFRRVANIYFLFAAACSLTPIAPFSPISLIIPLVFVVGVSMVKEGIEDWRRFLQDKEINNRKVKVHRGDGEFVEREWKLLKVGDIVKVEKEHYFPADLLLLASNFEDGIAYVETMNLDGETNLKLKRSLECTADLGEDLNYKSFTGIINCEDPNPNLYDFTGNLEFANATNALGSELYPLGPNQIFLRDSKLKNTEYIYGVVIFNGCDTKVIQNATTSPSKRSRIEMKMDKIIYLLFCILLTICIVGSLIFGVRTKKEMPNWWYIRPNDATPQYNPNNAVVAALLHFVTALILYGYIIPISLYVSIEIVKVLQATFINKDVLMFHPDTNKFAGARTSNLNEELGQVQIILSDKTGTLTCNMMEFFKCSIAGISYGCGITEVEKVAAIRIGRRASELLQLPIQDEQFLGDEPAGKLPVKGFNLKDDRLMDGHWKNEPNSKYIELFFRVLAVCHTAIPERDNATGTINYEVESPDEGAFVIAAREFGFEFYKRTQSSVLVNEPDLTSGRTVSR